MTHRQRILEISDGCRAMSITFQVNEEAPSQVSCLAGGLFTLTERKSGRRESNPRIELGKLALCH